MISFLFRQLIGKSFSLLIVFLSAFLFIQEEGIASPPEFFTIDNVPIEISLVENITPIQARQKAFSQGAREAFLTLVKKLSPETSSWDVIINAMPEQDLEAFVADFEMQQEKISPIHYQATLTYRFKAEKVRDFFLKKGVTIHPPKAESVAKPLLIIPVLKTATKTYLWEEENMWKALWQEGALSSSDIPLIIPIGDLQDMQLVTAAQAEKGDLGSLDLLAQKYKATGGALVLEATLIGEGPASPNSLPLETATVKVDFLYGVSPLLPQQKTFSIPEEPTNKATSTQQLLDQAVRKTIQILNTHWVKGTLDQTGYETPISVQALFSSKKDWFDIHKALTHLKEQKKIKDFKINSLSKDNAWIHIIFFGDPLLSLPLLQAQGIILHKEKGYWQHTPTTLKEQSLSPSHSSTNKNSLDFDHVVLQLF